MEDNFQSLSVAKYGGMRSSASVISIAIYTKMELWTLHQLRVWSRVAFSSYKALIKAQQSDTSPFPNIRSQYKSVSAIT